MKKQKFSEFLTSYYGIALVAFVGIAVMMVAPKIAVAAYHLHLERQAIKKTAWHEARHVIATWYAGGMAVETVTVVPQGSDLGGTNSAYLKPMALYTPDDAWNECAISLAPYTTEAALEGAGSYESTFGVNGDVNKALHIIDDLKRFGRSVSPPWQRDLAVPQNERSILSICRERAAEIIKAHEAELESLADELSSKRTLKRVQLEKLLGPPKP